MGRPIWTFAAYVTEAGGQIVQEWYDSLPLDDYESLQDLLNYMASAERWGRPEFDRVTPPLHEIREKANVLNHEIRIYGVFNPTVRRQFIFLHGVTAKKKDRDKKAQDVALTRLSILERRKGSIHEFAIEGRIT
jgi:hypothetical protein